MLEVTCAIIRKGQQVLICQRSASMKLPLKWEFPGGKVEGDETRKECIIREIKEELNLDIEVIKSLNPVAHKYPEFSIKLYPFICIVKAGALRPREHKRAVWASIHELTDYDWAAADVPIVEEVSLY